VNQQIPADRGVDGTTPDSLGSHGTLRRQVRTSLGWSLLNSLTTRGLSVVVGLIMARLLTPEQFGVFGIGLVALNVLQSMNELGTSVAIVRWPGDPTRPARTAVTVSVASSTLLFAACFALAPWVASSLNAPEAVTVLRLLALGLVFDGISSIPNALLTRAFLQGRRTVADLVALVVSSSLGITLAVAGYGALSLAWGTLAGNACATVLIFVLAPSRPRPGWDRSDARRLIAFGWPLAVASLLLLAVTNVDAIVVGRVLGPAALGFYLLALNLSNWPPNLLSLAIRRVAIPGFAQLRGDLVALRKAFARSLGLVVSVVLPASLLLSILADTAITTLYGETWEPAVGVLQWLAVLGTVRVATNLCYDVLLALGRSRTLLGLQLLWLVSVIPALAVGAHMGGIRAAATAHVIVAVAVVAPAYVVALHRAGIAPRWVVGALVRPLAAAAVAGAVALIIRGSSTGSITEAAMVGAVGLAVFAAVVIPFRSVMARAAAWIADRRLSPAAGGLRTIPSD
jgi:PST family polysaccharide transporter